MEEKEALRYDLDALRMHIEKRRENIEIFEDVIRKEREAIERELRMISIIEAHRDGGKD